MVLAAQAYGVVFGLTPEQTGTICAAILSVVGLLVLYQVCKPFDRFRKIIWVLMALGLVLCFTTLGNFLELHTGDTKSLLVMGTLMIMSYSVFTAVRRVFDWGDTLLARFRQWREKRRADL